MNPKISQHGVTTKECAAMRLLARDGWEVGELRLTMQLSRNKSVHYHVRGECAHEHQVPEILHWDGKTQPETLTAEDRVA